MSIDRMRAENWLDLCRIAMDAAEAPGAKCGPLMDRANLCHATPHGLSEGETFLFGTLRTLAKAYVRSPIERRLRLRQSLSTIAFEVHTIIDPPPVRAVAESATEITRRFRADIDG